MHQTFRPKQKADSLTDNSLTTKTNNANQLKNIQRATSRTHILHNIPNKHNQNLTVGGHGN